MNKKIIICKCRKNIKIITLTSTQSSNNKNNTNNSKFQIYLCYTYHILIKVNSNKTIKTTRYYIYNDSKYFLNCFLNVCIVWRFLIWGGILFQIALLMYVKLLFIRLLIWFSLKEMSFMSTPKIFCNKFIPFQCFLV